MEFDADVETLVRQKKSALYMVMEFDIKRYFALHVGYHNLAYEIDICHTNLCEIFLVAHCGLTSRHHLEGYKKKLEGLKRATRHNFIFLSYWKERSTRLSLCPSLCANAAYIEFFDKLYVDATEAVK